MSSLVRNAPARSGPASAITAEVRVGRLAAFVMLILVVLALAGCGSAPHHPAASKAKHFGGYPSFLPRNTLNYHSDTVLTGTVQRPALTSQGDGVEVKTPAWSVLITVTGPQVPGEGLPYQAPTTTCRRISAASTTSIMSTGRRSWPASRSPPRSCDQA